MSDQSQWPAYLRDDAPYKTCDTCGRKSWSEECRIGTSCGMPQPSGASCEGHFVETQRAAGETP